MPLDNLVLVVVTIIRMTVKIVPASWLMENLHLDVMLIVRISSRITFAGEIMENSIADMVPIIQHVMKRIHARKVLDSQSLCRAGIVQSPGVCAVFQVFLVTGNLKHYPLEDFIITPAKMIEILNTSEEVH